MPLRTLILILLAVAFCGRAPGADAADAPAAVAAQPAASASKARVVEALQNLLALERPRQTGYATVWDGNKYIQCKALADHSLRCEAAGSRMQSSLDRVLTPDHVRQLTALGWRPDPAFGNYVQHFPPRMPADQIADQLLLTLASAYAADVSNLGVQTDWLASEPCPPRNGPSQNLAGMVNDAPAMAPTAVHACFYMPEPDKSVAATSTADLVAIYGGRVLGEVQRIRVNHGRRVFVIFDAAIGYVQCESQDDPAAIYCEAQSADEWPALAGVLTPERIARLHALGYADPGRAPNYSKTYPLATSRDEVIAQEILTVLHEVYGYTGAPDLDVKTEKGDAP